LTFYKLVQPRHKASADSFRFIIQYLLVNLYQSFTTVTTGTIGATETVTSALVAGASGTGVGLFFGMTPTPIKIKENNEV
jgi:hypothetical protein